MDSGDPMLIVSAIVVWLFLFLLVGGSLLRASIALFNQFGMSNDPPTSIPVPSMFDALGINFGSAFAISFAVLGMDQLLQLQFNTITLTAPLAFVCTNIAILYFFLPTTIGRAVWVATCQFILTVFVIAVLALLEVLLIRLL